VQLFSNFAENSGKYKLFCSHLKKDVDDAKTSFEP